MWAWTAASVAVHAALIAAIVTLASSGASMGDKASNGVEVELLPVVSQVEGELAKTDVREAPEKREQTDASGTPSVDADNPIDPAVALSNKPKENNNIKEQVKVDSRDSARPGPAVHADRRPVANPETDAAASTQLASSGAPETDADVAARQASTESESARRNLAVRSRLEHFKHYPASARRRGIEGAVDVSFSLNAEGRAENMQLLTGSGYTILDDAALSTVRRAEPFPVTEGSYRFRLRFTSS